MVPSRRRCWIAVAAAWLPAAFAPFAAAQLASPHAIDIPRWFSDSFLDFDDEAASAAAAGKRVLLYFGQDGCPYCRELMQTNFSRKDIADKTRRHFVAIALNIWGDRELTWIDGRRMTEKELARALGVQFTPTLLFVDGSGRIVVRLNGYQPPNRFAAVLDYVAGGFDAREPLASYLEREVRDPARAQLAEQPIFMKPPHDLRRRAGGKPLAVIFETRHCRPCDEMHDEALRRPEVLAELRRFDVARFALSDARELVTPAGQRQRADAWARELGVAYTPTVVFFADDGREVFRIDGYLRPFHFATSFEYVAGGGYRREPQFQRYLQAKAERLRAQGRKVDLWQ